MDIVYIKQKTNTSQNNFIERGIKVGENEMYFKILLKIQQHNMSKHLPKALLYFKGADQSGTTPKY